MPRSLGNSTDEVDLLLSDLDYSFDVLCFSKTWFITDDGVYFSGSDCTTAFHAQEPWWGVPCQVLANYKISEKS